jgi:hypothetical protein
VEDIIEEVRSRPNIDNDFNLSSRQIKSLLSAYVDCECSVPELVSRFRVTEGNLSALREKYGVPKRSGSSDLRKPRPRRHR